MQCFFCITVAAMVCLTGVSGIYHELSVSKIKAPNELRSNALFGYSIAYQQKNERLIVSAPFGNWVGQVFQCHLKTNVCTEIRIPQIKEESAGLTDMWLGATVAAGSDFTVACAPRFTKMASPNITLSKNGTFGKCYISPAHSGEVSELKSLEDKNKEKGLTPYEKYMDSFGWAANVDRHDSILVGGPAMHTGRVILYSSPKSYPKLINNGVTSIKYNFGYSVTSGQFVSKNEDEILYAISSPYGEYGYGKVILTNGDASWILSPPREYPPPVGSLFGGSLCSAKLRGLGQREALLIGAPLYAENGNVDVGAVYIYQFDPAYNYVVHQRTILGTANRGRFGSAIINLGDLNGDNKDEVAISAPYEDSNRGAVYIYSAADILADEPADKVRYLQKIQPEGYSTLGFSMTALRNYDNSNALAIGAPVNNTVLFYRCLTTIIVHVQKLKEHIDNGYGRKRRNSTHFQFDSCVDINYPANRSFVNVDIAVKVSLTHPTARIVNSHEDGSKTYNISTLAQLKRYCSLVTIVMPEEGSYEPVIQYQVSATQINPPTDRKYFDSTIALLSDLSTLTRTDTVWVADCDGGDNKCVPVLDFEINTTMQDDYIIGSTDTERVTVAVQNTGDPAYTACVRVGVTNVRVRRWPPGCKRVDTSDQITSTGICSPKQPIRNNTSWNSGDIELETKSLRSNEKEMVFTVDLHEQCSSNIDKTIQSKIKKINLSTDPKGLVIRGSTNLGDIIYLSTDEIDETGKQFSHVYTVFNIGVTTWVNINCDIVLDNKSYFKGLRVTIDSQAAHKCNEDVIEKNGQYVTKCTISELKSSQKFDIIVSVYIEPKTIDLNSLEKDNMSLTSYLKLSYGNKQLDHSVTSILRKKEAVVPLWVIIVATLVGLLIMLLIAFALYECGFLRRKNKEKLKELKRNVHRQSMRRSAIVRESKRSANTAVDQQSDEKKLVEESEGSEASSPTSSSCEPPPAAKGVIATKSPEKDLPSADMCEKLPTNITDGGKIKKELIILGLQKNIGTRQYPVKPPKPKPQETYKEMKEEQDTNEKN